jgi:hypothetical protein
MADLARDPEVRQVQQRVRQGDLARQGEGLAQALDRLAQERSQPPQEQLALGEAAEAARRAEWALRQAQHQMQAGVPGKAWTAQEQAIEDLELAAEQALKAQPSHPPAAGAPRASRTEGLPGSAQQVGRAVRQARGQMERALGLLADGQDSSALAAMRQAAQSLRQAARTPEPADPHQGQPGQTAGTGGPGDGMPTPGAYGPDGTPFAGKTWGELPGEVRTKIVQDTKARYGEEYAQAIKLYFEQIADRSQGPRRP